MIRTESETKSQPAEKPSHHRYNSAKTRYTATFRSKNKPLYSLNNQVKNKQSFKISDV